MKDIVRRVFEEATHTPPRLSHSAELRIASLGEIIALARTHVVRSAYGNREIEYAPEAEANTRISKGIAGIAKGVAALRGQDNVEEQDLQDAFRVGLDCLRDDRRRLFLTIVGGDDPQLLRMARTTRDRQLEELAELQVLKKGDRGYELDDRVSRLWRAANCRIQTAPICSGGAN